MNIKKILFGVLMMTLIGLGVKAKKWCNFNN
jgi:hypothetical protein